MIRIDHLIHDDYVCNPLLDDPVTDVNNAARVQTNRVLPIVSHMLWSMIAVVNFRGVWLQADTIVVSCGLANFEQSSWSTDASSS